MKAIQRSESYSLLSQLVLGGSSQAVQQAANIAIHLALELPHSRQDEYEADAIGTRFAYNAGFPANGLQAFLQRLDTIAGRGSGPSWLQTHPSNPDRIAREKDLAAQILGKPRPVPVNLTEKETKILKDQDCVKRERPDPIRFRYRIWRTPNRMLYRPHRGNVVQGQMQG